MNLGRAIACGLAAWNYAINRKIPARRYVAANLLASAVVLAAGRSQADSGQLGLRLRLGPGLLGAAAVAVGAFVASRLPATAGLFYDQRVNDDDVVYQTAIRIPLGTVVLEEMAFRSVLPAMLDGADRTAPSVRSAALFGLWHIIPTLNTLDINGVTDSRTRAKAVVAGVGGTAAAGLLFDRIRLRTGSVLTPMLVHWSANAVAYAIAAQRRQTDAPE